MSPYFKHRKVGFFSILISQFIDLECDVNTVEILNVYEEAYGEIDIVTNGEYSPFASSLNSLTETASNWWNPIVEW